MSWFYSSNHYFIIVAVKLTIILKGKEVNENYSRAGTLRGTFILEKWTSSTPLEKGTTHLKRERGW